MNKILIVDDDLVVLATLNMGLQRAGYQVFQADNGELALQLAQSEKPGLAILDMRMPGMNGLELARRLRESSKTPFIFLSAFNDEGIVKSAADAGALGYLVKPIEVARIVPAIEVALVRSDEFAQLELKSSNLADALHSNREIDIALGLLMERYRTDRAHAFAVLRNYARNQRCKVISVAQRLISGERIDFDLSG